MKISKQGLSLIKKHEGYRSSAYLCPANVWTIGYGHTKTAKEGMKINEERALKLLQDDVEEFEKAINRENLDLEQHEFDTLVSFVFNVGIGAFRKSTLLRKIKEGRKADVPAQLMRWTKAGGRELPGLVKRRRDEAELWRSLPSQTDMPQLVDEPKGKPWYQSTTILSTGAVGTSSLVQAVAEIKAQVDTVSDVTTSIITNPYLWLAIAAVLGVLWVVRERKRMSDEYGI